MLLKKILYSIIYLLLVFMFIELLSLIFLKNKDDTTLPNYNLTSRNHYLDNNEIYGVWHIPNSNFKHKKNCFNVNYIFNSIGARDSEFLNEEENRIFLLGDSYVEGYGVKTQNKLDVLLENLTSYNILNFGTSGHFGTTQERLLYEFYSTKFDHDIILQVITVANDFEDDDFIFNKNNAGTKDRYRPYLIKNEEAYELFYTGEISHFYENLENQIKMISSNFTHTYHFIKYLRSLYLSKQNKKSKPIKINYYQNYKEEILDIFFFNFDKINEIAKKNNRKYMIILAPDFYHLNINEKLKETKLSQNIYDYAKKNEIEFLDLMSEIYIQNLDIEKMFYNNSKIDCDSHPNKYGVQVFGDIINKSLREKNVLRN